MLICFGLFSVTIILQHTFFKQGTDETDNKMNKSSVWNLAVKKNVDGMNTCVCKISEHASFSVPKKQHSIFFHLTSNL